MAERPVYTADSETDPFLYRRKPLPFIWGLYGGSTNYRVFDSTKSFVEYIAPKKILVFAHNGGKFDWMYLLPFIEEQVKAQVINGRIVSMLLGNAELRDSFAIIPEPLSKFGNKKEIDYKLLEADVRHLHMEEIKDYLYQDCKGLYDAVVAYRRIAGTKRTIASNALAFAKKIGIDPGKSNHRFDTRMRKFYYGGRVECFRPGSIEDVYLLDIHSAYPFAMIHDHATGTDFHRIGSLKGLTKDEVNRCFIKLTCNSQGAFPVRTKGVGGGISFPEGFGEFRITGWEYNVAKEFGLISKETILSVRHTTDTINFKPYVDHWYAFKAAHSEKDKFGVLLDPVNYTIGKIMQNSLYGKLAQNPARYYDYKFCPAGTPICEGEPDPDNDKLCGLCGEKMNDHGWQLHREYTDHEIHRRSSLWKYKFEMGEEWQAKAIYKNVATGASITGFTRAHLLRAMCTIGRPHIIYCDTDGIVCDGTADLSGIRFTPALGDWGLDDHAPLGHFAGKKLYGIRLSTGKHKIASKGSKLAFADLERLINGETVTWENPAPSFAIDGSVTFVRRNIRATAQLIKP
jgi:hypothetical protein